MIGNTVPQKGICPWLASFARIILNAYLGACACECQHTHAHTHTRVSTHTDTHIPAAACLLVRSHSRFYLSPSLLLALLLASFQDPTSLSSFHWFGDVFAWPFGILYSFFPRALLSTLWLPQLHISQLLNKRRA